MESGNLLTSVARYVQMNKVKLLRTLHGKWKLVNKGTKARS